MVTSLPDAHVARLSQAPYTYGAVGATRGDLPAGYRVVEDSRTLRRRTFDEAAELLLTWQLHERSGLSVAASSTRVATGSVVVLGLGVGRVRLRIPCRVVHVIHEPDRRGFAYGTLAGHPEEGEELFLLVRRADGGADLTVRAFSRPASRLARVGGPVSRRVQDWMTQRYLRALDG